ncbi:MAG: metalloregulator ArsR/SmtB family transcription factor [Dissulfuribacterales bacterium]
MKKFVSYLKAAGDGTRFKILKLLQEGPACVCELTEVLGLAQPTVSKHLRILEHAGLVESERNGMRVDYRIHATPDSEAAELFACVARWLEGEPEIERLRLKLKTVRGKACETSMQAIC